MQDKAVIVLFVCLFVCLCIVAEHVVLLLWYLYIFIQDQCAIVITDKLGLITITRIYRVMISIIKCKN